LAGRDVRTRHDSAFSRARVNEILDAYEMGDLLTEQCGSILLLDQANLEKLLR
jgi:hypothetical protein